jgi:hypothetical protein
LLKTSSNADPRVKLYFLGEMMPSLA